jgi:hypothetical protein
MRSLSPFFIPLPPNFEKPANAAAPPLPLARIVKRVNSVTRMRIGSRNCTTTRCSSFIDCWSTASDARLLTIASMMRLVWPSDFG